VAPILNSFHNRQHQHTYTRHKQPSLLRTAHYNTIKKPKPIEFYLIKFIEFYLISKLKPITTPSAFKTPQPIKKLKPITTGSASPKIHTHKSKKKKTPNRLLRPPHSTQLKSKKPQIHLPLQNRLRRKRKKKKKISETLVFSPIPSLFLTSLFVSNSTKNST
jgi:hypothetical protein